MTAHRQRIALSEICVVSSTVVGIGTWLHRKAVLSLGVIVAGSAIVAFAGCGGSQQLSDYKWTDETPSWSPSGREIVFASNRANPTSRIDQLYVMNANGTGVKRLFRSPTDAREPSFSPDGRTIVYVDNVLDSCGCFTNAGEISIVRANGTVIPRPLSWGLSGDASLPAWSPDGHLIAFFNTVNSADGSGRSDLYVVRPDGTGLRRLATNVDGWAFAWSPDGKRIALSGADEKLYLLRVDSTKAVHVAGTNVNYVTTDIGWSPDGSKLAFVRGARVWDGSGDIYPRYLWVLDLKSHKRRRLNAVVDSQSVASFGVSFTWLPRRIPTLVTLGNDYESFSLVRADGRGRHLLPASGGLFAGSASPDGKKLLFVDGPSGSFHSAIFLGSVDGRQFGRLTQVKR